MKKFLITALSCALALTALTACGDKAEPTTEETTPVTPMAVGLWDRNAEEHWQNDGDTKKELGKHQLDGMTCTICGCDVLIYENGGADVVDYNEDGKKVRASTYGADGTLITEDVIELTYTEEGKLAKEDFYTDGVLMNTTEYNLEGSHYRNKYTSYYADGSTSVNEYDSTGNAIVMADYSPDGTETFRAEYTYEFTPMGTFAITNIVEYYNGIKASTTYNDNNEVETVTTYDENDNVVKSERWEYTYDENDRKTSEAYYVDDAITKKTVYTIEEADVENWTSYASEVTEYFEDGSYEVTQTDENGNTSVAKYDKDGNITE